MLFLNVVEFSYPCWTTSSFCSYSTQWSNPSQWHVAWKVFWLCECWKWLQFTFCIHFVPFLIVCFAFYIFLILNKIHADMVMASPKAQKNFWMCLGDRYLKFHSGGYAKFVFLFVFVILALINWFVEIMQCPWFSTSLNMKPTENITAVT